MQHFASIHLLIVFAIVMATLNANLDVVAIKQFVSHNVHVDPVVLVDVPVDIQLLFVTFVKLKSALISKKPF